RNRRALAATARDRAVPGAARYGAWQRVGGLPLGCGADVVVAACEAETPGSDRPSNRYSSGVLVPRLLAHLPHFLVVVSTVVVLSVRVSKLDFCPFCSTQNPYFSRVFANGGPTFCKP